MTNIEAIDYLNRLHESGSIDYASYSHLHDLLSQEEFPYSVIATVGKNNPEARVGSYRSNFEAIAVSDAWNAINNKHGVTYRVEVDW